MRRRSPLREPTGPFEFFLGLLALVSVGIFLVPYLDAIHLSFPTQWAGPLITLDVAICIVFGADFLFRMARAPKPVSFARQRFIQPFAAIPLNTPIVSDIQILMVLVVVARFVRAANVVVGDRFVQSLFHRYSTMIAREISMLVLVRSLFLTREVVRRGRFAKSIADALDRRRGEVHGIVTESLAHLPAWEAFQKIPGTDEVVEKAENLFVETVLEIMRSERLNILVANVVDDSLEDFKAALEARHPEIDVDELGPETDAWQQTGNATQAEWPRG